jgi:hypothetical protein
MKTALTPSLQFSGYPVKIAEMEKEEKPPAHLPANKKHPSFSEEKRSKPSEVPENWDESWFANYE